MKGYVEESAEVLCARHLRDAARKMVGDELLHGYSRSVASVDALLSAAIVYAATQRKPRKSPPKRSTP